MKNRRMKQAGENKRERGSILATSAIGMLSILLAVGLGVDISRFYLAKNELQNAADAAALAGVSALNTAPLGITKAVDRAVAAMNNYDFNNTSVTFPRANVLFAVNLDGPYMSESAAQGVAASIRFVRVTTPESPVGVSFAATVLGNSKNLKATATAGLSVPLNIFCNFLPVSVIDYGTTIMPGNTYTFRASSGTDVSPGNYQILAVAGEGGKDVRIGIGAGVDACAAPGSEYAVDTKPGVTAGAVRQGLNTRFDEYVTSQVSPDLMPPDTNIKEEITYDQYKNGSPTQAPSHKGVDGRRVVVIPIVKQDQYDGGRNVVRFDRFGTFFLQTKVGGGSGGDLVAEYVDDIVIGQGGFDPSGAPASDLMAVPVLYR
ncbi:MAG TPA: pilus assembly protein TadG-related protein [Pyrinomonadaceae bacterium]|nr:pilus assembly protein TadG-related protein [Pyrinomonadaceae bacterium]